MPFPNFVEEMISDWRIPQLEVCARGSCAFVKTDRTWFSGKESISMQRYASLLFNIAYHRDGSFVGCPFSS